MPNKKTHLAAGAIAGLVTGLATMTLFEEKDRFAHVLACTLSASGSALLPDLIEPALNPRHRSTAHSLAAAAGIGALARARHHAHCLDQAAQCERRAATLAKDSDAWRNEMLNARLWRLAVAAILGSMAGYASHLVLDGMTPMGLPLLLSGT
ncbi:MAG: metal-dependent hydrolase [Gemmatimonadota bacterium]